MGPAAALARWNGATITPLGSGLDAGVHDALELPNGDLLAGAMVPDRVLRWDGATWSGIGIGPGPLRGLTLPVTGLLALPTVLPQGLAGCSLLASPDALSLLPASGGAVTTALTVPNLPALVGPVRHQQVASIELGPGGAITAVATTNALVLTIGSS